MNIKHILFPVDFSECSRSLNPEGEWVANHFDSDVTLLHVFEIPATWYWNRRGPLITAECFQQFAGDAKKRLEDYPLGISANRVTRIISEGDAAQNIKNWVDEHAIDLIMMGTHGYGSLRRTVLGSVAVKVLHGVSCPIWTHSLTQLGPPLGGISRILCALELTQEAVHLLRYVSTLAKDCAASVRIIHAVSETESMHHYRYFDMGLQKYLKECAAEDIRQSQRDAGTDFAVTITDGSFAKDTAALATEQRADLVVIGRGRTKDVFGTLRTHSYDIVRQAPCSVLSYCPTVAEPATSEDQKANGAVLAFK